MKKRQTLELHMHSQLIYKQKIQYSGLFLFHL